MMSLKLFQIPQRYRFSSKSQLFSLYTYSSVVVLDTTKVQIFKQITTLLACKAAVCLLFQIPQRYRFSSKSQLLFSIVIIYFGCFRYHKGTDFQANHNCAGVRVSSSLRCFRYHKGTDFQANHNRYTHRTHGRYVVLDTTKVQIFKQITTKTTVTIFAGLLFQIPQRYRFSSKSQLPMRYLVHACSCFRYHKGTDFQANHN